MSERAPGHPEHKNRLLAQLDEKSLPYLAADILAICYRHTEVQVVDGPGDGKRDVHSVTPRGLKCVTQCKHHKDPQASISAREADELPVALVKFGARCGFFVTNARLSPQACREYLEGFPGFDLTFLQGDSLISEVLRTPSISAHWLSGEHFSRSGKTIFVPMLLREAETDAVINPFPTIDQAIDLDRCCALSSHFHPYRPPTHASTGEDGGATITITSCLTLSESQYLHDVEAERLSLATRLAEVVEPDKAVTLRFGCPVQTTGGRFEPTGSLPLSGIAPISFILHDGKAHLEVDWLSPPARLWSFPHTMPGAIVDWTSWVSDEVDVWLRLSLPLPLEDLPTSHGLRMIRGYERECRRASLYATGLSGDCDDFLQSLPVHLLPALQCANGPGGRLLGWLHPHALPKYEGGILAMGGGAPVPEADPEFEAVVSEVRAVLAGVANVEVLPSDIAEHILAANGMADHRNAYAFETSDILFHPDQIPSPILLRDRDIVIVSWWRGSDKIDIGEALRSIAVDCRGTHHVHRDVVNGPTSGDQWGLVSLVFRGRPNASTESVLDSVMPDVIVSLGETEERLAPKGLRLASREFWNAEIGLPLD